MQYNQIRWMMESFIKESSSSFSLNVFKELPTLEQQLAYATKTLTPISLEGGGRAVFDLGGNKVLKVSKTDSLESGFMSGILQNKKEVLLSNKLKSSKLAPEVFDYSPDGHWVISEKVQLIDSEGSKVEALYPYTGLYWKELDNILSFISDKEYTTDQLLHPEKYPELQDEIEEETDYGFAWRDNKNIINMFTLIDHGIHPLELNVTSHYGVDPEGNLVIVDLGH